MFMFVKVKHESVKWARDWSCSDQTRAEVLLHLEFKKAREDFAAMYILPTSSQNVTAVGQVWSCMFTFLKRSWLDPGILVVKLKFIMHDTSSQVKDRLIDS